MCASVIVLDGRFVVLRRRRRPSNESKYMKGVHRERSSCKGKRIGLEADADEKE